MTPDKATQNIPVPKLKRLIRVPCGPDPDGTPLVSRRNSPRSQRRDGAEVDVVNLTSAPRVAGRNTC